MVDAVPAKVRPVNVATPLVALTVFVPPNVPPLADTVTAMLESVTMLFPLSSTFTTGCVDSNAPAVSPTG